MQRLGTKHVGYVTYAVHSASVDPLASLPLERIFACPTTGRLFPPWHASLHLSQGSTTAHKESLRTFYCSVCVSDVKLLVDKDHLDVCGVCGWEESKAGIKRYDDLFTRAKNPFPHTDERIRNITQALNGGEELLHTENSTSRPASDEELRGFHKLAPDGDENGWPREHLPKDMVILDGRVTCDKIPPRLKIRAPKIDILSPYTLKAIPNSTWSPSSVNINNIDVDNWFPVCNSARFLPHFDDIIVYHDCTHGNDSETASYSVRCVNPNPTAIYVRINDRARIHIEANESDCITFQPPFKNNITLDAPYKEPHQCSRVFDFHCEVDFEDPPQIQDPITSKKWAYKVFVWHDRRCWTHVQL